MQGSKSQDPPRILQADFHHSPLGPGSRAIRMLYLYPTSDPDGYYAAVQCSLIDANLNDLPKFKALSYVWGDAKDTCPIIVDGGQYNVTVNCLSALLRLREIGELYLWIDAICINQRNDAEKSVQVALMSDIYFLASQVIIWLGGPEVQRSEELRLSEEKAFKLLWSLAKWGYDEICEKADAIKRADYMRKSVVNRSSWTGFVDLYFHPWFERLWVYQEYVLGTDPHILSDYHFLPMYLMGHALQAVHFTPRGFIPRSKTGELLMLNFWRVFARIEYGKDYDRDERRLKSTTMLSVMDTIQTAKCYDPRDRAFAIIGLFGKDSTETFNVDYTASLFEVYTNLTIYMIKKDKSLDCLCFSRKKDIQPIKEAEFPSWVCDWREERRSFLVRLGLPTIFLYSACLNTKAVVSFDNTDNTLKSEGVYVDSVLEVFPILHHIIFEFEDPDLDALNQIVAPPIDGFSRWQDLFRAYPNGYDPLEAWIRVLTLDVHHHLTRRLSDQSFLKSKAVVLDVFVDKSGKNLDKFHSSFDQEAGDDQEDHESDDSNDESPSAWNLDFSDGELDESDDRENEKRSKVFSRGYFSNQLRNSFESLRDNDGEREEDNRSDDSAEDWQNSSEPSRDDSEEEESDDDSSDDDRGDRTDVDIRARINDSLRIRALQRRSFFITKSGYMGLGPLWIKKDDMVCVLLGASSPLAIRKEKDYHRLLGECFVWGLMDGEVLKDRKESEKFDVFRLR